MKPFLKWLPLLVLFVPGLAVAHPGGAPDGFASGFAHPWSGMDHLLAMLSVGIWARQQGGKAVWAIPCAFVAAMVIGGVMGLKGVPVPAVEQGIAASVLALGLMVAMAMRLPTSVGMVLVAVFAVFHGHAHGAEMPLADDAVGYACGFTLATALLHVVGIGLGSTIGRVSRVLVRLVGVVVALSGVWLMVG